ncbi:MAG: hypothetical protein QMD82_05580 [bacterium]|nr:hypothetical protein [bacterium]
MEQASEKTLVSLAYLKVLWDKEGKDLLDIYLYFLAEFFRRKNYSSIDETSEFVNRISKEIEEEFGLKIPYHPLLSLLNRARKRKLLEKTQHTYYIKEEELSKYVFNVNSAERSVNNLIKIIAAHASNIFPQKSITEDRIKNALINYLNSFGPSALTSEIEGLDVLKRTIISEKREELFIVNRVILYMYENDKDGWSLLQNVATGYLLSNIILYDQNAIKTKLKGLKVYLDTRIILRLIGGEGEEMKEIYKNFINKLKEEGIKLRIFQHTYEEVMDILDDCYKWIDSPAYDPSKASLSLRHFKEKGFHQSDIILISDKLKDNLLNIGIEIELTPQEKPEYSIDRNKLKNYIREIYEKNPSFVYCEKELTIERDVQSISAIYQLWQGSKPINLKQAKCIFITSNAGLAYASSVFHKEKSPRGFYIPPCITDIFLGTMVWLNDPVKVQEIMPMTLISMSMAILRDSGEFMEKWYSEIKKLLTEGNITEEDFILLRDSQIARELLDKKNLGDPEAISPKTAIEILQEIEQRASQKYEEERRSHEKTREELEQMKRKEKEREEKLSRRAQKYATMIIWFSLSLGIILLVLSLLLKGTIWKAISIVFTVILFILGALGITVKQSKQFLVKRIKGFLKGE